VWYSKNNLGDNMNTTTKKETQRLIEKYFFGQNNDELVI
jgi:hypothetical protein